MLCKTKFLFFFAFIFDVYDLLFAKLYLSGKIFADETPIPFSELNRTPTANERECSVPAHMPSEWRIVTRFKNIVSHAWQIRNIKSARFVVRLVIQ